MREELEQLLDRERGLARLAWESGSLRLVIRIDGRRIDGTDHEDVGRDDEAVGVAIEASVDAAAWRCFDDAHGAGSSNGAHRGVRCDVELVGDGPHRPLGEPAVVGRGLPGHGTSALREQNELLDRAELTRAARSDSAGLL